MIYLTYCYNQFLKILRASLLFCLHVSFWLCVCACVFTPWSCGITGIRLSSERTFAESISEASPQSLTFPACPLSKTPPTTTTSSTATSPKSHTLTCTHSDTHTLYAPTINLPSVTTTAKHKANHINTAGMPHSPSDEMSLERLCQETSGLLKRLSVCECVCVYEREREQKI